MKAGGVRAGMEDGCSVGGAATFGGGMGCGLLPAGPDSPGASPPAPHHHPRQHASPTRPLPPRLSKWRRPVCIYHDHIQPQSQMAANLRADRSEHRQQRMRGAG